MRTTRAMLMMILLGLMALAGCTDASNPVGLDAPQHRLADATADITDQQTPSGGLYIQVSEGAFAFAQVSTSDGRVADYKPLTGHITYQASVSYVPGQSGEGVLDYRDSKGQRYTVEIRQVHMKKDGALLLGGPVRSSHAEVKVPVWFYAEAHDHGPFGQGDLFRYRLGAPGFGGLVSVDSEFIDLVVMSGDLAVHQMGF